MKTQDQKPLLERRGILVSIFSALSLFIGGYGWVAFEFLLGSKTKREPILYIKNIVKNFSRKKNTIVTFNGRKVFIQLLENDSFSAHSMICTHGSCTVEWQEKTSVFICPCHNGAFNKDGSVLRTPPKKELEQLKIVYIPNSDQLQLFESNDKL